jgi:Zn-dependent alcohol dehydrogenase
MSETRALVLRDQSQGRSIERLTVDEPRPGEVLVELAASGICGSDLHAFHGQSEAVSYPMVLGHEAAVADMEAGRVARCLLTFAR